MRHWCPASLQLADRLWRVAGHGSGADPVYGHRAGRWSRECWCARRSWRRCARWCRCSFASTLHFAENQLQTVAAQRLGAGSGGRRGGGGADLSLRHHGLQRRRHGDHHRGGRGGKCASGRFPAEDPLHRRDAGRRIQRRRGGPVILCGRYLWLPGWAAAGDPGRVCGGAGIGGGVLRCYQLSGGLHVSGGGAVWDPTAFCTLPWSAGSATCSPATMDSTPARRSCTPS